MLLENLREKNRLFYLQSSIFEKKILAVLESFFTWNENGFSYTRIFFISTANFVKNYDRDYNKRNLFIHIQPWPKMLGI